jgi:soluble lytic murein transglycosylase
LRFAALVVIALCSICVSAERDTSRFEERQRYLSARAALTDGRIAEFKRLKRSLRNYPLHPYLELADLLRDHTRLDAEKVADFRERAGDSPIAERLRIAWLTELARRRDWKGLRKAWEPTDEVELRCAHLEALIRTGASDEAFEEVAELWRVPRSQPKACDYPFDRWRKAGKLSQPLAWERFVASIEADETALARYVATLLDGEWERDAATLLRLAASPRTLRDGNVSRDAARAARMVAITIRRLARRDAAAASELWRRVASTLEPDAALQRRLEQDLTIARARQGQPDLDADLSPTSDGHHRDVIEALLQAGIATEQWTAVESWVRALDPDERAKPRWRYWLARALGESAPTESEQEVEEIYGSLARERQYYGFLAAMMTGAAPVLNESASTPNAALIAELRAQPAIQRVEELFAVDAPLDARREWQTFDKALDREQRIAAAHLAAQNGWTAFSVQAANTAELLNDLALRFPAPRRDTFSVASRRSTVPLSFLYAVARQESIFDSAARSSAGALGVMQLMPGTALATARRAGLPAPRGNSLLQADLNIDIGARHLAELMERFGANRVLVAAAYNAGPLNVDRWLAARPPHPVDVWIEAIPFVETRNYVMNVLAFAYVYGQLLDAPTPFLTEVER